MLQIVDSYALLGSLILAWSEVMFDGPLNPCQSLLGSNDHNRLAQVEISIPLQVILAISESSEKEAHTHMGGTVVGWWIDVE